MKYFKKDTKTTCHLKDGERNNFGFKLLAVWLFVPHATHSNSQTGQTASEEINL